MDQAIVIGSLSVGLLILAVYIKNRGNISQLRIDPQEAKRRLDKEKGIVLLDVRSQEEYIDSHIPKSISIPLSVLRQEASERLPDKQTTIFAYCRSGNRSRAAVKILLKQGYNNVFDLGGIVRWPFRTVSGNK
ncbi:Rhodanese-related sulfurtransferase [Desulfosporosinus hippei DSM 8344]|uniref:Rhodanese-related sulfurtransferase n=2 Tax=Desulfosporosinus TaxID=79206 RepID=A0A1G7W7U4_9FIRM|nr:rhodanese-like domain-containing protein [Desulfosporosinus hippei]SDG68026.1 Rhodanese-related sulfurtransferase [Desulfosporosinus hippei DSM 8344]